MKELASKILNPESSELPLVVLHGLFGMSDNWLTLGKKFAEKRPVHLIDLRNHGDSFHSDEMSLELIVEDVNNYLISQDISICFMMGHSLGGKVVLEFIPKYLEKLKKAIIVDIGLREYPPHHQNIIKGIKNIDFSIDKSRKNIDQRMAEYIPEVDVRQFLMKNVERKEDGSYKLRINLEGIEKNYISLLQNTAPGDKISLPVLFIKGEKSHYIEDQDILTVESHFPNSKIVTISEAGHWVHAQNPKAFYDIVENYLIT